MALENQLQTKAVLKTYINNQGDVDYSRLQNDPWLKEQLEIIQTTDIHQFSRQEEFVFWLNAYNLLILKAVCDKLANNRNWKGNISYFAKFNFFALKKYAVGGKKLSLYTIENKILRKKFNDPRIHFAINCASKSCPILPNRLFQVDTLEQTLENLTENFINSDHVRFDESSNELWLNPIFDWYKKDFKSSGGLVEFIKKYWHGPLIPEEIKIKFLKYDWSLNSQ